MCSIPTPGYIGIARNELAAWQRVIFIIAMLALPAWTATSWMAMRGKQAWHGSVNQQTCFSTTYVHTKAYTVSSHLCSACRYFLLAYGAVLLVLYAFVGGISVHQCVSVEKPSLLFIFGGLTAGLALFETAAFLCVVGCFRNAIVNDSGEQETLLGGSWTGYGTDE